ncbi:MAG: UvrD-helicase domain-containing protein [Verrucomicrobia bacterium]|nr:UvrD-helicase domain-containing protein [Verrucomicrobiota bacterium]
MPLTVIHASAGSGKTYKLAVAYLELLLRAEIAGQALDPSRILATTFTRAAAGEILDRVLQLLSSAVLSEADCSRLAASTDLPLTQAICGRVLRHIAARLDQLTISTMDSFFGQIAKAFSAELGMAPGWQMAVNEAEAEVQRATVYSLLKQADQATLLEALTTFRKQQVGSSVQGTLDGLSGAFQKMATAPASPFHLPVPRVWEAGEIADALRLFHDREKWAPKTKTGKIPSRWNTAMDALAGFLQPGQKVNRIFEITLVARILEDADYDRQPIPDCLHETMAPLLAVAREEIQRQHRARMEAFAWLAQCYQQARLSTIFEQASYTFTDVTRTVGCQAITGDDLYFRLGTKYQHVLFDEFQDTSRQQYEFFRPLLEEIGANGDASIFVVGDEKQAIYGWRGGDREVMHGPLEALGKKIGRKDAPPLNQSYRSSPAVLNAVNQTVRVLMNGWCPENPLLSPARLAWGAGFSDHVPAQRVAHLQGRVRLFDVEKGDDPDKAAPLIAQVVELVHEHRTQDPQRKIAILLRKKNLMSRLIAEIRRACPEADVSGEGGSPLTDSRAVEWILSLLTYLDHPGHTAARYHVLSCPARVAFGFPESVLADTKPGAEEWNSLSAIRRALMHLGLAEVLRSWIRAEAFVAQCTGYDALRCEQLLELAREFDQFPTVRLSPFVEHVRNRRMERQGGAAVRILTVHASKGLEFETVILMDLDAGQRKGGTPSVIEHEGELQLVPSKENADFLEMQPLYAKDLCDEFMGELSVLYVGMTRARSFLDIVLRKDRTPPIAHLLRTALCPDQEQIVQSFEGISARACDTAQGQGAIPLPEDPGIAKTPVAPPQSVSSAVPHMRASYATPSSQEDAGFLSANSILAPANRGAMKRGELIHAWLSRITWVEDEIPTAPQLVAVTEAFHSPLSREQAAEEAARLLAQIQNPASPLSRVFSKGRFAPEPRVELWRERRFAVMDTSSGSAELLTGCFDRVVLWRNAEGTVQRAEILDFKTDRFSNEAEQREIEERYRPQLAAYQRALCLLLPGLGEAQVQASLCFVGAAEKGVE